ncbi:conserved hypothetical protein [Neospora caninum Liverpool]|uniref:Uncharacterized protein n=1 Tax=Neospora caninum (strain Liverpool) TaxID=572307 RepID=F0VP98_NEOCL|nr:conserved hypothetical protein [Neospora caninum Liverpool]CBZ55544.1 conserved hypothetical protein [Neospora caninum Liverpool]CEL70284.1 TPA: hypothetical protein BN1204_059690 [Neospora caninum Liverpool]|eukprot:XP_003885572.1 conserved hypothetical protein [Neospora caninum Liverpool]
MRPRDGAPPSAVGDGTAPVSFHAGAHAPSLSAAFPSSDSSPFPPFSPSFASVPPSVSPPGLHARGPAAQRPQAPAGEPAPRSGEGAFVGEKLSRLHALRARLQKSASAPAPAPVSAHERVSAFAQPSAASSASLAFAPSDAAGGAPLPLSSLGSSEDFSHSVAEAGASSAQAAARVSPPRDVFVAQTAVGGRVWSPASAQASASLASAGFLEPQGTAGGAPLQPQRDGRLKPPPSLTQSKRKDPSFPGHREDQPKAAGVAAKAAPVVPPPAVGARAPRPGGGDKIRVLDTANKKAVTAGLLPAPPPSQEGVSSTSVVSPQSPVLSAASLSPPLASSASPATAAVLPLPGGRLVGDLRHLPATQPKASAPQARLGASGLEIKPREGDGVRGDGLGAGLLGKAAGASVAERGFGVAKKVAGSFPSTHAGKAHAAAKAGAAGGLLSRQSSGSESAAVLSPPLSHASAAAAPGLQERSEGGKGGKDFDAPTPFEELMRRKREAQMAERQQAVASLAPSRSASLGSSVGATAGGEAARKLSAALPANSLAATLASEAGGGAGARAGRQQPGSVAGSVQAPDRRGDSSGKFSPKVPPRLGSKPRLGSPLAGPGSGSPTQTLPPSAAVASAQGEKQAGAPSGVEGQEAHAGEGDKRVFAANMSSGPVEGEKGATGVSSRPIGAIREQGVRGPETPMLPSASTPQVPKGEEERAPRPVLGLTSGDGTATKTDAKETSLALAAGSQGVVSGCGLPTAGRSAATNAPAQHAPPPTGPVSAAAVLRGPQGAGGQMLASRPVARDSGRGEVKAKASQGGAAMNREGAGLSVRPVNPVQGSSSSARAEAALPTPSLRSVPTKGGVAQPSAAGGAAAATGQSGGVEGLRKSSHSAAAPAVGKASSPGLSQAASVFPSGQTHGGVVGKSSVPSLPQAKMPEAKASPVAVNASAPSLGLGAAAPSVGVAAKHPARPQPAQSALAASLSSGLLPGQKAGGAAVGGETRPKAAADAGGSKAAAPVQAKAARAPATLVTKGRRVPQADARQGGASQVPGSAGAPAGSLVSAKTQGNVQTKAVAPKAGAGPPAQPAGAAQAALGAGSEQGQSAGRAQGIAPVSCALKHQELNDYCHQLATDLVYRSLASDAWPASVGLSSSPSLAASVAETLDMMSAHSDRDMRDRLLDIDRASSPCGGAATASSGSNAPVARSAIEEILGPFLACALECGSADAAAAPKDAVVPFASMAYEELKEGGVAAALGQSLADVLLHAENVDLADAGQLPQAVSRLVAWTEVMEKRLSSWGNEFLKTTGKKPFTKGTTSLSALSPLQNPPLSGSSSASSTARPESVRGAIRGTADSLQRQGGTPGQAAKRLRAATGSVSIQGQ